MISIIGIKDFLGVFMLRGMIYLLLFSVITAHADYLLLDNNKKLYGEMTAIAHEYIEFTVQDLSNENKWLKVPKKQVLAVLSDQKKILYPRDKFDENALNYGRIKPKNKKEKLVLKKRQLENIKTQRALENQEKNRFKVAAVIGGLSGLMLYAFLDGRR
jgi:hypothetical protein